MKTKSHSVSGYADFSIVLNQLHHITVAGISLHEWSDRCRQQMLSIDDQFDVSHKLDHVERVFANMMLLASEEKANLKVLVPAAWLHDCVPVDKRSSERAQASTVSSRHAIGWLENQGYDESYFEGIEHAIQAHSYSAKITPKTIEAKVLQDADRLDSLGPIGIARVFMLGGKFNNVLYDVNDPFAKYRELNDKRYVLDHFYVKLLNLQNTMQTECGRRQATVKTQYMLDFIQAMAIPDLA